MDRRKISPLCLLPSLTFWALHQLLLPNLGRGFELISFGFGLVFFHVLKPFCVVLCFLPTPFEPLSNPQEPRGVA